MMATQRHPTRRASRVSRSKFGLRVSTTVEYKMAGPLLCYFGRCIFLHAIHIYFYLM